MTANGQLTNALNAVNDIAMNLKTQICTFLRNTKLPSIEYRGYKIYHWCAQKCHDEDFRIQNYYTL